MGYYVILKEQREKEMLSMEEIDKISKGKNDSNVALFIATVMIIALILLCMREREYNQILQQRIESPTTCEPVKTIPPSPIFIFVPEVKE